MSDVTGPEGVPTVESVVFESADPMDGVVMPDDWRVLYEEDTLTSLAWTQTDAQTYGNDETWEIALQDAVAGMRSVW